MQGGRHWSATMRHAKASLEAPAPGEVSVHWSGRKRGEFPSPRRRGERTERAAHNARSIVYHLYRTRFGTRPHSPNLLKIQIELEPPRFSAINPFPSPAVNRLIPHRD
jgi:hypothetical protein